LRLVERPRDEQIVALRADGLSLAQIGARFGVSRQRVDQILRGAGVAQAGTARSRAVRASTAAAVRELHANLANERCGEILEAYRRGVDPREIARELGLQREVVRGLIAGVASDADRAARRKVCQRPVVPRYSDVELARAVVLVASRLGHTPTCTEYDRAARELGLASVATVCQRAGSWTRALEAAGLEPRPRTHTAPRWDAAACWQALHSVADQLGDPPSYQRYAKLAKRRKDLPSAPTVRQRLGLWHQIVAQLTKQHDAGRAVPAAVAAVQAANDLRDSVKPTNSGARNSHARGGTASRLARERRERLPSVLSARTLRYLAEHPGSSSRTVGRALEIKHDSQTSTLLHRLQRDGLLTNQPNGTATAWTLTQQGHRFLNDLPEGVYV